MNFSFPKLEGTFSTLESNDQTEQKKTKGVNSLLHIAYAAPSQKVWQVNRQRTPFFPINLHNEVNEVITLIRKLTKSIFKYAALIERGRAQSVQAEQ